MNAKAKIKAQDTGGDVVFPEPFTYLSEADTTLTARQIGLVSGADVPLLALDLPDALRGHAREQVAERQMRDALSGGSDRIEIRPFHSAGADGEWSRVLVADRDQLDDWRRRAGASCKAVLPDYLGLPTDAGLWTIASRGPHILVRLGPDDGFSATHDVAIRLLKDALAKAAPLPRAVFGLQPLLPQIEALFKANNIPVAESETALTDLGLSPPRVLAHGELAFDLRRDPRAARAQLKARILPWRWPVLVGLVAMGLWAVAQMVAIRGLEDQAAQHRSATLETVRAEFVPTGPVLDIRTQVSRALAEARVAAAGAGETVSPLDLLGLSADVMRARRAQPDFVAYTVADGLSTVMRVENFAAADDLAAALREAGLAVTVVESRVSEGEDGVRTELRIAAPDSAKAEGGE